MKICRACLSEKPLDDFYRHKRMADGHLNVCKECVKKRSALRAIERADFIREYEKARATLPHRIAARKEYAKSKEGKEAHKRANNAYRERFPIKKAAHIFFRNFMRKNGHIKASECSECKSTVKIEAHHDDYTKPLSVRWLCEKCHKLWHKENKPIFEF